eukprot:7822435-Pyramimonas_sp.AAC.1
MGASRFPWQSHRPPKKNPGHPGGKQGISWHGLPPCRPRIGGRLTDPLQVAPGSPCCSATERELSLIHI